MRPITSYICRVLLWAFAVGIMVGFVQASGSKSTKSFTETCLFDRCKFRNNHIMGTYCNNNKENVFDYDWTQWVLVARTAWSPPPQMIAADRSRSESTSAAAWATMTASSSDTKGPLPALLNCRCQNMSPGLNTDDGFISGEFHESCNDCQLSNNRDEETQYIVCYCSNLQGKERKSKFDLDEVMYNDDGTLGCFDHLGSKFSRPPKEWDDEDDPAASAGA